MVNNLGWSWRATTRAAQKLPPDVDKILEDAFLCEAYVVCNYAVPPELWVNTDQTQTVYQHGNKGAWHQRGDKQVGAVGKDEKCAFTLVPLVSASGDVLPFQAIFQGATVASCPHKESLYYEEAINLGFKLEPSKSSTYWSTLDTMRSLVNEIIAPYFERKKRELGIECPEEQRSIWKINCWSVHNRDPHGCIRGTGTCRFHPWETCGLMDPRIQVPVSHRYSTDTGLCSGIFNYIRGYPQV
ncbi:hypothetical protein K435DRAFT_683139 [Dendrothele bispora CBS 962.96]|uniref:Uncharacterized protein n=1 Tax=Dendrothele bispora (strain CBS 962.96) TaxID=1314807 RepID=A0A4S8LCQ8_DENBC|nr:hypothetical protein K435DRAFT_683139 [Dendrothele bispora CBS 962.96]